jgi:hypothetical protein
MSKGVIETITGAVVLTAGIFLEAVTWGFATPAAVALFNGLIGAGAGMVLSGIGTMVNGGMQPGLTTSVRNPVKPWDIIYGRSSEGGTLTYIEDSSYEPAPR